MKVILLLISLVLIIGCNSKPPTLYIPSDLINLGDISYNKDVFLNINVTNLGDKPLILSNIKTSCKCIIMSHFKDLVINKNEVKKVSLLYKSDRIGEHMESISIISNDVKTFKIIRIKANVR